MNARVSTAYEEGEKKRGKTRNRGCVSEHPESSEKGKRQRSQEGISNVRGEDEAVLRATLTTHPLT